MLICFLLYIVPACVLAVEQNKQTINCKRIHVPSHGATHADHAHRLVKWAYPRLSDYCAL